MNLFKRLFILLAACVFVFGEARGQISIQTDTVIQTSTCGGANVFIPFTVSGGQVPAGTIFTAELSNGLGQFNDPVEIGNFPWIGIGFMIGQIPEDQNFGFLYRIRVVAKSLGVTGSASPNIVVVTTIPQLANITISPTDSVCNEPILLNTGFANEYRWNTGETTQSIEVNTTGTYSVTLTDLIGCEIESDPVNVIAGQSPPIPEIQYTGLELQASEAFRYQWYLEGDSIPGATERLYAPVETGNYQVRVFSPEGCPEISELFLIPELSELMVYPNPASEALTVKTGLLLNENFSYTLHDYKGHTVRKQNHKLFTGYLTDAIDISDLPQGNYILLIFWRQQVLTYRIVKSREE